MSFKRSALLTAGAVFAASLIANAASPVSPVSTESSEKPVCKSAKDPSRKAARTGESAADEKTDSPVCKESDQASSASDSSTSDSSESESSPSAQSSAMPVMPPSSQEPGNDASDAAPHKSAFSPIGPLMVVKPIKPLSSDPAPGPTDQPNTVLTPEGMAVADTALGYCAATDADMASGYASAMTAITQGHADSETAALRLTPEYAKTQAAFSAGLTNVTRPAGISACRTLFTVVHSLGTTSPIRTPGMGSAHD